MSLLDTAAFGLTYGLIRYAGTAAPSGPDSTPRAR
jgi:hypothetical protein